MSASPGRHHRDHPTDRPRRGAVDADASTRRLSRLRGAPVVAGLFLAIVAGAVALATWSQAAGAPRTAHRIVTTNSDARVTAVGDAVSGYLGILETVDGYQTLKNGLPFGGGTFLDPQYKKVFTSIETARAKVRDLAGRADTTLTSLDAALDDIDGNGDLANDGSIKGVVVDLDVDFSGNVDAASFQAVVKVTVKTSGTSPLNWVADGVTVNGQPANGKLGFTSSTTVTITAKAASKFSFKVNGAQTGALSLGVAGTFASTGATPNPLAFKIGVLGVKATGNVSADIGVKVTLVDPGTGAKQDGVIDSTELGDPTKLFALSCVSKGATANLTVSTDLAGLTAEAGSLTLDDATLCDGISAPKVTLAKLGDLKSVSVGDVINGVAQVTRALQSAQAAGDLDLPFVTEGLSQVVQVNERLVKFFVDNKLTDPAHPLDTITFDKDKPPFATVQELAPKLEAALGLKAGSLGLQYADGTIRFTVHQSGDPAAAPNAGTIDVGDTLGKVGIGAVKGTAKATIDPKYALDFGFGFSTAPGLALTDRFFLTNDATTKSVFTLDAAVTAQLALEGTIPPAGVTVGTGGTVPLLARVDAAKSMLSVALVDPTPADGRVTLSDIAKSVSGKQFPVSATVNAQVPSTALAATLDLAGTDVATGSLTVAWPDITKGAPTVTADAAFKANQLQFAFDTSDPKKLVVQLLTAARSAVTGLRAGIASGKISTTTPLPIVGKSVADLEPVLVRLQGSFDTLIATADSITLPALEAKINQAVASALEIKTTPVPDLSTLTYEPATADKNAAIKATLALSVCTNDRGKTCTVSNKPGTQPFTLALGDSKAGGIASVDSAGTLSVGYDATAQLSFGVTLPKVAYDDTTGTLSITGTPTVPTPFVQDDTSFVVGLGAKLSGSFSAAFGPFTVSLGKPASGSQDAQNAVAQVAARFALKVATPAGKRYGPTELPAFFSSLVPKSPVTVHETGKTLKAACPDLPGTYDACANLPVFLDGRSLGSITFSAPDLLSPSGWSKPDTSAIEKALSSEQMQFGLLVDGIRALSNQLERSLRSLPAGTTIPLVGTNVLAGADAVKAFNESVLQPVQDLTGQLAGLNKVSTVTDKVTEVLESIKAPTRSGPVKVIATCRPTNGGNLQNCVGNEPLQQLQTLQIQLPLHLGVSAKTAFDLGFTGLSLKSTSGTLTSTAGVDVALAFGVDRDLGFFVPTGLSSKEFSIAATASLPATMQAQLGFVPITVTDLHNDGPDVSVGFDLDLATSRPDGRLTLQELGTATLTPKLTATAVASLQLQTKLGAKATSGMPTMSAQFDLNAGVTWTPGGNPVPSATLGFSKVQVDLGSVMAAYIKPAIAEIRKYTSPLEPAIDAIQQPIPGVKQAAELIGQKPLSWYELFKEIDKITTPQGQASGLQLVDRLIQFVQTVKALDEQTSTGGTVDLGSFSVSTDKARVPTPVADADELIASKSEPASLLGAFGQTADDLQKASAEGGLKFPVLEKPSSLFGMLLGQDVDLVTFDAGKLQIQRGLQFGFPIGPLNLYIGGSASLSGHFAAGFDTYGIRKAFEYASDDDPSNNNVFSLASGVLLGLYLDDFDVDDNDVPEITFRAELTAGASIGIPLFSVGAEGGIGAQIDFDLHTEPAQNGKIRYSDIAAQLKKNPNPLCFFDASAKIDAFIRAYLETPLGKSIYPIASGVVWQQDNLFQFCQTPVAQHENQLGEVVDGEFRLASDPAAPVQDVVIRQNGADSILVEAQGLQETYTGVTRIYADLGDGADQLDLVRAEGYDGTGLPARVCGGAGVDRIASDLGPATLSGDGGDDCAPVTTSAAGGDTLTGGSEADVLDGGPGDDVLVGGDGGDALDGGAGNDVLRGGAGTDTLVGGDDNDTVDYADHTSAVTVNLPGRSGSVGESDQVSAVENVLGSAASDTVNLLAAGSYRVDAGFGDDVIRPGAATAIVFGGAGKDTVTGARGVVQFLGGDGDDRLLNGPGIETFLGGPGTDTANYAASTTPVSLTVDGLADDGPSVNGLPTGSDNLVDVDVVIGGSQADRLAGSSADETLQGNAGMDVLEGGGGNDTLLGGADDDRLVGGDGDDRLDGAAGNDTLDGGVGADTFIGGSEFDTVDYSARTDDLTITKNGVADDGASQTSERDNVTNTVERIVGGSGSDTISGNSSNEEFVGGPGNDEVNGYGGADVFEGGPGDDDLYDWQVNERFSLTLDGTAVDRMSGGPGADEIYANGGNDVLDGGSEADTLYGGTGDDTIDAGPGSDTVYAGPEVLTGTVTDNDTVKGGDDHDGIFGGAGNDIIDAGPGGCTIHGGLGNDTITSGTGDCSTYLGDTSTGSERDTGPNTFIGGTGRDDVVGGDGPDTIDVGTGGSFVNGHGGNDVIRAGAWSGDQIGNTLNGDEGDDTLYGGPSADVLKGSTGNDHLFGGSGNDQLYGNGFDATKAGPENDDLHGEGGDDGLYGEQGNDLLDGGTGADDLDGGDGSDTVTYADRTDGVTVGTAGFWKDGNALDDKADGSRRDAIDNDIEGIVGGNGADRITFGAAANRTTTLYLTGGPGADILTVDPTTTLPTVIDGGAGADVITGGAGPDRALGGTEDDLFVALSSADGADVFSGGAGTDTVDYSARSAGSVTVTLDDVANDGASTERDDVRSDVEKAVLGTKKGVVVTPDAPAAGPPTSGAVATTPGATAPTAGPAPTGTPAPPVTPVPTGSAPVAGPSTTTSPTGRSGN